MSTPDTKKCFGFEGHWECADKYPDHEVPKKNFGSRVDDLQPLCRRCNDYRNSHTNPLTNAISALAIENAGGQAAYGALPKYGKERKGFRAVAKAQILSAYQLYLDTTSDAPPMLREDWVRSPNWKKSLSQVPITVAITEHSSTAPFPATDPEPVFSNSKKKTKTTTEKRERDPKVVRWVQKRYSACSIEGCGFKHFHVAHVHALRNDDADDLPNNCVALCPNHHWELDNQELRLVDYEDRTPDDPIFVLWADGKEGIINLADGHTVENSNIEKGMESLDKYFSDKRGSN